MGVEIWTETKSVHSKEIKHKTFAFLKNNYT